ncbi:hypothetical protein D3C80_1901070 [compost metagenome]
MKASRMPMSAWNFSAEKAQVATDRVMVTAVNTDAVPRCLSASTKACSRLMLRSCISCLILSKR